MVSRPDGVFGVPLSHVFPNLTSLKLRPVTQQTLAMLLPLAPALEIVHLLGPVPLPIDYSHFFRSISVPCRIHELQIYSALRFVDALELFVRVHDGPWTLTFGGHHVSFYGDAVSWDIESHSYILQSLAEERDFVLHLERLAAFELPLALFVEFVRIAHETPSGAWTRQLPHLRALTLLVDVKAMFHSPSPFSRAADAGIGIGMPALEAVEFRCADAHDEWDFGHWIADVAPVLLAELLGGPRTLARVVIRTKHSYEPSRQDVAHLLQHAERVLVCAMVEAGDAQLVFERSTAADSICDALEN